MGGLPTSIAPSDGAVSPPPVDQAASPTSTLPPGLHPYVPPRYPTPADVNDGPPPRPQAQQTQEPLPPGLHPYNPQNAAGNRPVVVDPPLPPGLHPWVGTNPEQPPGSQPLDNRTNWANFPGKIGAEFHSHPVAFSIFQRMARFGLTPSDITSVVSGPHVPGSAHFDGRAVDVGAIGGVTVGNNTRTIAFLMNAIAYGNLQRIGSTQQIISNPTLREYAGKYGVDLFEDEGTGPHIHLQVGPHIAGLAPGRDAREALFRNASLQPALLPGLHPMGHPGTSTASPAPSPTASLPPGLYPIGSTPPVNPMDTGSGTTPALPFSGTETQAITARNTHVASSFLNKIAAHQDLSNIIMNAWMMDGGDPGAKITGSTSIPIQELLRDPNSNVRKAWDLYHSDSARAMDIYGGGSPIAEAAIARRHPGTPLGEYSNFRALHPRTNAAITLLEELFNPVALTEGAVAGRVLGLAGQVPRLIRMFNAPVAREVADAVEGAPHAVSRSLGFGHPLHDIHEQGGVDAQQWLTGGMNSIRHEDNEARRFEQLIFGNLTAREQEEVVALSQGHKILPEFANKEADLMRRGEMLRQDIAHVTNEQIRTKRLTPTRTITKGPRAGTVVLGNVNNLATYFPMSNSYDFGEEYEIIRDIRNRSRLPGGGNTKSRPKVFDDIREARASGLLDKDFSPASNYYNWRRQRMQGVAFDDMIERAPQSMVARGRRGLTRTNEPGVLIDKVSGIKYIDPQKAVAFANRVIESPRLRSSLPAHTLWKFLSENQAFQKYIAHGTVSVGEEESKVSRWIGILRNVMLLNPFIHPGLNLARNDAAVRGLHDLGGNTWEKMGWFTNAARAAGLQLGIFKPEQFVGGAQEYARWMERALLSGAEQVFSKPRKTIFGGERSRVMTERVVGNSYDKWIRRLDKALTGIMDTSMDRTFGDRGERSFVGSFFKDAVQSGRSDYQAARLARKAYTDYYALDHRSPWAKYMLFMPWYKGDTKLWAELMLKKPAYATSLQHAIRDYNMQQGDPSLDSPYAPPDFRVFGNIGDIVSGSKPDPEHPEYTSLPFSGAKNVGNLGEIATSDPDEKLYAIGSIVDQRGNPFTKMVFDGIYTLANNDFSGPETDRHMIFNKHAPLGVQWHQILNYLASRLIPVPLVQRALTDAARKGYDPKDVAFALLSAAGGGFESRPLSAQQRYDQNTAISRFRQAIKSAGDDGKLQDSAYNDFWNDLKVAGIVR